MRELGIILLGEDIYFVLTCAVRLCVLLLTLSPALCFYYLITTFTFRWVASLLYRHSDPEDPEHMSSYVAVTADKNFRRDTQAKAESLGIADYGSVVIGNWAADMTDGNGEDKGDVLCEGEMFDTILADYLVGAVDHFAPFFQDLLFPRLVRHLKPGGRMYLTGLNPIPESSSGPGDIFCRITKLRDACILLSGARPYREHPVEWVERHLPLAGLKVIDVAKFPKTYNVGTIGLQIEAARSTLKFIQNNDLRQAMSQRIDELEEESKQVCANCVNGEFELGFDWIVSAELLPVES